MSSNPLPVAVVRDLLGIVRSLWRAGFAGDASKERLRELEEIGRQLKLALDLAKAGPGTMGGRAAWGWAEQATQRLGALLQETETVEPLVRAIGEKLRESR